jgi:hypothetical protein
LTIFPLTLSIQIQLMKKMNFSIYKLLSFYKFIYDIKFNLEKLKIF